MVRSLVRSYTHIARKSHISIPKFCLQSFKKPVEPVIGLSGAGVMTASRGVGYTTGM